MFLLAVFTWPAAAQEVQKEDTMDRIELCRKNYTALFGGEALTGTGTDPELMDILQKYIFGEVFAVGDLDLKTRELITCTVLSVMQTLPQLKAHAAAALTVGVTPVELREAVYQCAPFVGFPKTLNAVSVVNEVFRERGISLPLEAQGTVTEADRYRRGATIQHRLYGDEAGQKTTYVPGGVGGDVARLLTGFCFGDFYTRQGLDLKTRELLVFCMLTTLEADGLLRSHVSGNLELGNTPEILAAAVNTVHALYRAATRGKGAGCAKIGRSTAQTGAGVSKPGQQSPVVADHCRSGTAGRIQRLPRRGDRGLDAVGTGCIGSLCRS